MFIAEVSIRQFGKAGALDDGAYAVIVTDNPSLPGVHVRALNGKVTLTYSLNFKGFRIALQTVSRKVGMYAHCPICDTPSNRLGIKAGETDKGFQCIVCARYYLTSERSIYNASNLAPWEKQRAKAGKIRKALHASDDISTDDIIKPDGMRKDRFFAYLDRLDVIEAEAERLFRQHMQTLLGES